MNNNLYLWGTNGYTLISTSQKVIVMDIQKDVPAPSLIDRRGGRKYPFNEMAVGDSILLEKATYGGKEITAAKNYFRRNGKKMTSQIDGAGIMVWRIS
jgi:hypothetical protein